MTEIRCTVCAAKLIDAPSPRCAGLRHATVIRRMPVYDANGVRKHGDVGRPIGFDVVFELDGERYSTRLPRNPGNRITVAGCALAAGVVTAVSCEDTRLETVDTGERSR
ncbi:MAG: hypothetical protein AB7P21_22365 [Lautropia sp.]